MKIISLNACSAYAFDELMAFIGSHAADTGVFCFQEIMSADFDVPTAQRDGKRADAFQEVSARLPGFRAYYAPVQEDLDRTADPRGKTHFGLAMFVKEGIEIEEHGDFFICNAYNGYVAGDYETLGYNAQYVRMRRPDGPLTICSVHGVALPAHKLDTPARLAQSEKILSFLSGQPRGRIVMGDFNLLPGTESVRMIERAGYRNLIREYGITTTRGSLLKKMHPEFAQGPYGFQEFADYAFVTPSVRVRSFEVPDLPVSDHLPLILEIED